MNEAADMNEYTVVVEAADETGDGWQPLAPAENVTNDGTADEVARWTADNHTMGGAGNWRVRVWDGADADQSTPEAASCEADRF
jgi:hypothetical protein